MDALLKDSEQLAAMIDNVPSVDNLDFIMESDALGHTVMDQRQAYESLLAVAETVTLAEVIYLTVICNGIILNVLYLFSFNSTHFLICKPFDLSNIYSSLPLNFLLLESLGDLFLRLKNTFQLL